MEDHPRGSRGASSAGGTCAHFVQTSYENPNKRPSIPNKSVPYLFVAGGMSKESAEYRIRAYPRMYKGFDQWNVASSISQRARQMTWRSFGVGDNISTTEFTLPVHIPKTRAPVLAVFSGQGPQAACMGRSLFMRYSVFRDSIMKSDKILRSYAGFSLVENTMLFQADSPPGLSIWPWPIMVNTMAIIFFQVALYDLMRSFDVKPDIIIGYSMGEVAAMYASGALTHEAVIQLMWESGESFLAADGRGAMAAAMCSAGEAENILTRVNGENPLTARLTISCFDSPKGVLVAGYSLGIKKFLEALAQLKIPCRELKVRMAAHSLFLDSFKEEYLKRLGEIFEKMEGNLLPLVPVISTVTGQRVLEPYTPDYVWRNIRQPVLFSEAVKNALEEYPDLICIEFAPNPALGRQIQEMGVKQVFPTLRKAENPEVEMKVFFENLKNMVAGGVNCLNFSKINGSSMGSELLPDIPSPFTLTTQEPPPQTVTKEHPWQLLPLPREGLYVETSILSCAPGEHVITNGRDVVAWAVYVELAMAQPGTCGLRNVCFLKPCTIYSTLLRISLEEKGKKLLINSLSSKVLDITKFGTIKEDKDQPEYSEMQDTFNDLHFTAMIERNIDLSGVITKVNVDKVLARCDHEIQRAQIYQRWYGIRHYEDNFRRIRWMRMNKREALTEISGDLDSPKDFLFNPLLMEAIFQIVLGFEVNENGQGPAQGSVLRLHSIDRCFRNDGLHKPLVLPGLFRVYSKKIECSNYHSKFNYYILVPKGEVIFTFLGVQYRRAPPCDKILLVENRFHLISTRCCHPAISREANIVLPTGSTKVSDSCWLRLLDDCAINTIKVLVFEGGTGLAPLVERLPGVSSERRKFISWCLDVSSKTSLTMSRILDCLPTKGYRFLPLLKAIGNAYIDLALDPTNAERLLFNDLSLEDIWNEVPFRDGVLARTVEEFKKLVKGYGLSKMVRVLELNAGHGCLTKALGNAIKEAKLEVPNLQIEYYCADLNFNLAERSAKTSPWQPVEPVSISFDGRIDLQGIPQVDIVVGLNTLYTLPSLKIGLLSTQSILLPGGFLILTELDRRVPEGIKPGLIWLDYVFGGLKGWFDSPNSNDEDNAAALGETSTRLIFKELGYLDPWFIEIENPEHACHRTLITQIPRLSDRKVLNYPNATPLPQVLIAIPRAAVGGGVSTTAKETSEVSTLTKWVDSFAYHYHFGEDAAMMKFLSSLDARSIVKLVLYTIADGRNNSALVGISRVVRQEFPVWHVQLIVFDPAVGSTLLSDYLSNHLLFLPASPPELYIKANRICEATELRLLEDVDRKGPLGVCPYAWKEGQEPWTHYLPPIGDDDVEIQVLSLQQPDFRGSCFGFSGRICQRGSRAMIPIGEMVVGISLDGPMASRLVCHWERVAKLTHEFQPQLYATIIRSMVTCDLIMGKLPERTEHNNHILIHGGPPGLRLGTAICLSRILIWKGWTVYFTSDSVDDVPVDTARIRYSTKDSDSLVREIKNRTFYKGIGCVISFTKDTALISASLEILWEAPAVILLVAKEDALHSISHLPGQKPNQSFTFIDPEERLRQDHHLVRDAILNFSKNSEYPVSVWDHKENLMAVIPPVLNPDAMVLRAGVVSGTPAFNPRATYVLVEGVCWMGLAMAKFIIEHGGLHVVISCRSSQNFLETNPNGKEKILLDSFRELPGVTVEVASAQVECASSMRALFKNQEFPVAGVIYFAPTSRGTAMRSSSQKSWDSNYLCRTGSVRVLLDSLDVEMLDWIVLCSPLSSTIGQSGQADICGAQTIVNSITAGIRNCTNVVIPPILDQDPPLFLKTGEKMDTWQECEQFGMKTADVCKHILDAIWCMPKSNHYIPDMDFAGLAKGGLSENMKWLKGTIVPKIVLPDSLPGITRIVSETFGVAPDEISLDIELRKVGMDAFQAIQLSQRLESEIGLKISYPRLFVPGLTVGEILQGSGCARTKMDSTSHTIPFFNKESMFKPDYLAVVRSGNRIAIGTPIFIISPPTIPTDSAFNLLANELPFPAYILPNPQLTPDSSLDTISEWYTQTILGILADCTSSFHIISFSDISPVILHLAEKLLNYEHTIESLVLLDSSPSLVYSRSFNSFMNDRIKSNYWEDVVLDRIEDMATLDTSLGLMSNKVQQAKEFFDGNHAKENKWCSEHLDTYIQFATILHAASTAVLNGPNRNPWKCFERMGPKVFLAKAKSGVVTEPWFCDSEIDKNWGIPETLDVFVKEYDCGHCGILARWTGLVESLRVFWGVDTGLESCSDMYEGGWDDYGYSSGIEGVEGCLAGGVVSA